MVGPFSVRDGEDNYQLYLIRPASSSQSDFINLLFDRPLLLLIVTMLVSSPLLLWLAWSLAKPARKLKNAADEVAQGNLRRAYSWVPPCCAAAAVRVKSWSVLRRKRIAWTA